MNIYIYKPKKRVLTNKILEKIHKKKNCVQHHGASTISLKKKKFHDKNA